MIINDLHEGNPRDVYLALDALKNSKSKEEKVLILISSLMAWQGTPRKLEEIKEAEDPNCNKKKEPIKKKEDGDEDNNNDDEEKMMKIRHIRNKLNNKFLKFRNKNSLNIS